jgi:ribosomal protein L24
MPFVDHSSDSVQIGDTACIKTGLHEGFVGCVTEIKRLAGTLTIVGKLAKSCSHHVEVPVMSVEFVPSSCALRFTADHGYDVRTDDPVVVIRADFIGRSGTVSRVNLDQKTLDVALTFNPSVCVMHPSPPPLPLTQVYPGDLHTSNYTFRTRCCCVSS